MNDAYLWMMTALAAFMAVQTLGRLVLERHRLWAEDLSDEDRAFAWRVVLFLVFPFITLIDLRATIVSCQWVGGFIKQWSYGMFWYQVQPVGLEPSEHLIAVLFAGVIVQALLALALLPSMFFRPHPFLATVLGYSVTFILGLNLIAEPLLALLGLGSARWQVLFAQGSFAEQQAVLTAFGIAAVTYLLVIANSRVQLWFVDLSRPGTAEDLQNAIGACRAVKYDPYLVCRLGLLFDRAGLSWQANAQVRKLIKRSPDSIYARLLEGVTSYRKRRYQAAKQAFVRASDHIHVAGTLRASLLAAAACSAYAAGEMQNALNLCERALEFDDRSAVARMVKVDVYLRMNRKESAGDEIVAALRKGIDLELEGRIPLDTERALLQIARLQMAQTQARAQSNGGAEQDLVADKAP